MPEKRLSPILESLGACWDARTWAAGREVDRDAYLACSRGDWLCWLVRKLEMNPRMLVAAACRCARLALPKVQDDDGTSLRVIEAAEAFARGEPDADERLAAVDGVIEDDRFAGESVESYYARQAADRTAFYAKRPNSLGLVALHARDAGGPDNDIADAVCEAIPFEVFADALGKLEGNCA